MKIHHKIAVWMNQSTAYLLHSTPEDVVTTSIRLEKQKDAALKSAVALDAINCFTNCFEEKQYLKALIEEIKGYNEVLLCGPTYHKANLYHALRADERFAQTKIGITKTGFMDENQLLAFVRKHFMRTFF